MVPPYQSRRQQMGWSHRLEATPAVELEVAVGRSVQRKGAAAQVVAALVAAVGHSVQQKKAAAPVAAVGHWV